MNLTHNPVYSRLYDVVSKQIDNAIVLIPNLVSAIILFVLFCLLSTYSKKIILKLTYIRKKNVLIVMGRFAQWAIILFGLFVSITIMIPSFKASDFLSTIGLSGVVIGFAFKDILQNFLSGILILITEPFVVGDEIIVSKGGFEGKVIEIRARSTTIRTYDDRLVVIPNSDLYTSSVTVNTAYSTRRNDYKLSMDASVNIADTKQKILSTLAHTEGVYNSPQPKVEVTDIGSNHVEMQILWWSNPEAADQVEAKNNIIKNLKAGLEEVPGALV